MDCAQISIHLAKAQGEVETIYYSLFGRCKLWHTKNYNPYDILNHTNYLRFH
jgi:hypothetical protein